MKTQATRIEQAFEQIDAMDSKMMDSLVESLENHSKLLKEGRLETPEEVNTFWEEYIGDVEHFRTILQILTGACCSHLFRKRMIGEILMRACIGVNDYGQQILKRNSVSIPGVGTYIASLDESGYFTATCESDFNLD